MASLKDVAQRANVSLMTVSRAINEPERLRPETYKKVMEAVDALGYVSDLSAKKIRGAKTTANTIGVLALDTMAINMIALLTLFGIQRGAQVYFEASMLFAMVGFISTVAFAKFILRGDIVE